MTDTFAEHVPALRLHERPGPRHNGVPAVPPAVDLMLAPLPAGPQNETVVALLVAIKATETRLRKHGDLLWQRTVDWHRTPRVPPPSLVDPEDEDEIDPRTTTQLEDAEGDALASRYKGEVASIANRIRSDLARLVQIDAIVIRDRPRRIEGKDMLSAQVAAGGLCVSCFRYDQTNKDREKDGTGTFYDKEACRRCAGFKRDYNQYPPLTLLEAWHARGKNWTTAMIDQSLERGAKP